jgi:hypothetical protein
MGEGMKSISYQAFRFPESAKRRLLVRAEASLISSQSLSECDQLSGDCTCGKLKQHSPNYGNHHDFVESRDQLKLLVRCNKHIALHREQIAHDVKVEQRGDKEFEQT